MYRTEYPNIDYGASKWEVLRMLWNHFYVDNSLHFNLDEKGWRIQESFQGEEEFFSLRRDVISLRRYTDKDEYGLLGLSLINPQSRTCAITEGVSDYITLKLLKPNSNVLGVTTLGGSSIARKILISLFDNIIIIADNDETGLKNASKWRKFLVSYGKKVKLWRTTNPRFKDITDQFLFNLRIDSSHLEMDGLS